MTQSFMYPYFLGPKAENHALFEELLIGFLRDHSYWRRNFHPMDAPTIPTDARYQREFLKFLSLLERELFALSADLKAAVPLFSPRYMGHMASDLLMPGLLAHMITTLYNPNNVSEEVAPITVQKELKVIDQLATMVGYKTGSDGAWGYLTSGGTVANYAAMRSCLTVKYFPLACQQALLNLQRKHGFTLEIDLKDRSPWQLTNMSIKDVIKLRESVFDRMRQQGDATIFDRFVKNLDAERLETLGLVDFFKKHQALGPPVLLAPCTAHYSWSKAMRLFGLGTSNIVGIEVDAHLRLSAESAHELADQLLKKQTNILMTVGVLGTTEYGTVDPIDKLVALREVFASKGVSIPVHVDAAWGGYLTTMFRNPDGSFAPRSQVRKSFRHFPSEAVYRSFSALSEVDSVTIDPHKLGYIPYPAGAYLCRHSDVIDFIIQKIAYVFDVAQRPSKKQLLRRLGQYIIEGSKPGSAAAAVYVTHKTLPLDRTGFGRIISETVHACEYLSDRLSEWKQEVSDLVQVSVPFEPDTNLVCLCINPNGNRSVARANRFLRSVYDAMCPKPGQPIQVMEFFGSYTSVERGTLGNVQAQRILATLDLDPDTFREIPNDPETESDHLFVLRHTLMNPWLIKTDEHGLNTLDHYLVYLKQLVTSLIGKA